MESAVQPVVEVVAGSAEVRVRCSVCPDGRRLPLDDLALRVGVQAFVDEHAGCGPVRISLPADMTLPVAVPAAL